MRVSAVIRVDDRVPVSTVLTAISMLGYKYEARGIQCVEDVEDEIQEGGVWIIAPGQGDCRKGEAYRVRVEPGKAEEVASAVEMIESIYLYLKMVLPPEVSPSVATISVVEHIKDGLDEVKIEEELEE